MKEPPNGSADTKGVDMKSLVFASIALIATAVAAQEGTTSVLTNQPTPAAQATAPTTAPAPAAQCSEVAKVAKVAPWQARRLNRIADRQEAREARKCCCDPCACEKAEACKCKARTVVVEARR